MISSLRLRILTLIFGLSFYCVFGSAYSYGDGQIFNQTEKIFDEKIKGQALENSIKLLVDSCSEQDQLSDCYDFLDRQSKKPAYRNEPPVFYYMSLARFILLRHLEDNKLWDEYFSRREGYLRQIKSTLAKARRLNKTKNALALRIKFLEWRLEEQNTVKSEQLLRELFTAANDFYGDSPEEIDALREIADDFFALRENNYGRQFYDYYISKIANTGINLDAIGELAENFFDRNQYNLSAALYKIYIERLLEEESSGLLIADRLKKIASKFSHPGWSQAVDPLFAESIYEKIEELMQGDKSDSSVFLGRAYNLERLKEYSSSAQAYESFLNYFPEHKERAKVYFRLGVIYAYMLRDIPGAVSCFNKVIDDFPESADYSNSLYHLGLISHWQGSIEKAQNYYQEILKISKQDSSDNEIVPLAKERLEEIAEGKNIEYNLRLFLGAVLSGHKKDTPATLDLFAVPAKNFLEEPVEFVVSSFVTDTGCLQPTYTYLWSGQLGGENPSPSEYRFLTDYADAGTKVVNVVLAGPAGPVGATLDISDIYPADKKLSPEGMDK